MSAVIPDPSPQLQTALKWINAFNNWNIDQILSATTDDYTHYILPQSLERPCRNKEEYRAYLTQVASQLVNYTATIHDIIESPDRVFLHVTSTATSTTGYPYANEYNITMQFSADADGMPKISVVKEFVDSKKSYEFFAAERERQSMRQAQQSAR